MTILRNFVLWKNLAFVSGISANLTENQELTKIFRMENTFDDHIGASRNSGFSRTPRKMSRDSTFRTRTQSLASNGSQEGGGAKQVKVIFLGSIFLGDFRKHNSIRARA